MMARMDAVVQVEAHARKSNAKVAAVDHGFKLRQVITLDEFTSERPTCLALLRH